ncbi:pyrroline-5-carboxylate reductase [Rhodopirellula sp. MGV]|uniref:pyrroline-5-carboxylate reductase n=1 Tax=Rhodopirellula sp. MGV TaxID=2023130 RepID=UPI000B95E4D8|nr:pyrroline-5-carboxylate reductase [Rhodopirellula sp. MGV]OYP30506.1 pyrroline-5-carboxylate reductase [Rhodopirellula sp. MGV]PNY35212.1 pyrroline-5-carboxylate reductase [Rhodopirellula baltica]
MKKRTVAIIGGGQMARALAGGMLASGVIANEDLSVADRNADKQQWWAEQYPGVTAKPDLTDIVPDCDTVMLAVKPYAIPAVAAQVAACSDSDKLVVSVAAGVSLQQLADQVGHQRIIRVMPNTPSLVGAGASAYCVGEAVTDEDCQWIDEALSSVGVAAKVNEAQMDAVTGLSGSGPAYICLVIEALSDGGVLCGLPRPLAIKLAAQTVMGAAKMVLETGKHPGELKDAVTSPGGTTIAAIQALEDHGLRAAMIAAVQASAKRSIELGS